MMCESVLSKGGRILQRLLPLLFLSSLIATLLIGNIGSLAQTTRPEIRGVWMTVNDKNILRVRKFVES
ncbi:MAG: hypothetical protein KME01_10300 [Chroococcus sp. CMT-3BRIN-NPC107]|nr:hypothetical protein [Chroococcus sp. CMT-3BRIN-NPC107]